MFPGNPLPVSAFVPTVRIFWVRNIQERLSNQSLGPREGQGQYPARCTKDASTGPRGARDQETEPQQDPCHSRVSPRLPGASPRLACCARAATLTRCPHGSLASCKLWLFVVIVGRCPGHICTWESLVSPQRGGAPGVHGECSVRASKSRDNPHGWGSHGGCGGCFGRRGATAASWRWL